MIKALFNPCSSKIMQNWAGLTLICLCVGYVLSPAFVIGAFIRRRSVAVTLLAAWMAVMWLSAWDDYIYRGDGPLVAAFANRVYGSTFSFALSCAFVTPLAYAAAGLVARWIYDNHKSAWFPLATAAAAFLVVLSAERVSSSSRSELMSVTGVEGGRLQAMTKSWKVSTSVIDALARTDRERLLVGYAQRVTSQDIAGIDLEPGFDHYIAWLAEACADDSENTPICRDTEGPLNEQRLRATPLKFDR